MLETEQDLIIIYLKMALTIGGLMVGSSYMKKIKEKTMDT
jgi:hypothetical protein